MSKTPRIVQLAACVLVGALLGGGAYAFAANSSGGVIHACVTRSHELLIVKRCSRSETALSWNQRGPVGPAGATGATGATGAVGPQGPAGQSAISAWETVDADGNMLAGKNLGITHVASGSYEMNRGTTGRNCAIQITPDNNSTGVRVPPIIASVFNGFPVQIIYLTDSSGVGVDDGFSVSVQC